MKTDTAMVGMEHADGNEGGERRRRRMVRAYPVHTLSDVLDVAGAIQELNAGLPFDRTLLAKALGTTPASSGFTMRLNSSSKYGLTQGGYSDERISLTSRGEAVITPEDTDERRRALVEAARQPDVFSRFYEILDGKRLPEDTYARNMLQRELGIHPDLTAECLGIVRANGLFVGLVCEVDGSLLVSLPESPPPERSNRDTEAGQAMRAAEIIDVSAPPDGRIFIGYQSADDVVSFVRSVLDQFSAPYGIAEAPPDDGRPVPTSVSEEMKACSSAIIVLSSDRPGAPGSATPQGVLYQLGAASVLYGDRVVLFCEEGLEPGASPATVHQVTYRPGCHDQAGLELLRELHEAGIIRVTV